VKLLFDENLSPRLVALLVLDFPHSTHVHFAGLGAGSDAELWAFARAEGYVLVSKDGDLFELSVLRGAPPKLVWIRRGNCSTTSIVELLRKHRVDLERLDADETARYLVIE
jgi:predicted nuclease of predicted toxin-antitoxin system